MKVVIEFAILFFCFGILQAADSSCGDWIQYKDEKCLKVFDQAGMHTYAEAEKLCKQQDNDSSSSLITIGYPEEQQFVGDFLKSQNVSNDLWIGVKYVDNAKYQWADASGLVYSNWLRGSPKNQSDQCVQILSDEERFGKWSEVVCTRRNLVVCQKMQTWSLAHIQKVLMNTVKNPFPIGFIYVQLSKQKEPREIWSWMVWKDVTAEYAGLFFRAEGGNSTAFGTVQNEDSNRLVSVGYSGSNGCLYEPSFCVNTGPGYIENPGRSFTHFKLSGGEVRPKNMAMRIWIRTG